MTFFNSVRSSVLSFKRRRALSQIMGALLMLAIVVPIGSVILFNGATEINAFNNSLANTIDYRNDGVQEDLVFEHIRFQPTTKMVEVSIRNTGSVETIIDRITLVNMTSQEILYEIHSLGSFSPQVLSIKNSTEIEFEADLAGGSWDYGGTPTKWEYKISIITARGNFFDTVARPYNT